MQVYVKLILLILLIPVDKGWCTEVCTAVQEQKTIENSYVQIEEDKTLIKKCYKALLGLKSQMTQSLSGEDITRLKNQSNWLQRLCENHISQIQQQCQKILELEQHRAESMPLNTINPLSEPLEQEPQSEQTLEQYYKDKKSFLEQVALVIESTLEDESLQALIKFYENQLKTSDTIEDDVETTQDVMDIQSQEDSTNDSSNDSEQEWYVVDDKEPLLAQKTTSAMVGVGGFYSIIRSIVNTNQEKLHTD